MTWHFTTLQPCLQGSEAADVLQSVGEKFGHEDVWVLKSVQIVSFPEEDGNKLRVN